MSRRWNDALRRMLLAIENQGGSETIFGAGGSPLRIDPYRSFGTQTELRATGRVLKNPAIKPVTGSESVLENLASMYRRFRSDEVAGVPVRASYGGVDVSGESNDEGYFDLQLSLPAPLPTGLLWHEVRIAIPGDDESVTTVPCLAPGDGTELGVISDIDDTVIVTGVTSMPTMLRTVFFENARTRKPFAGVSALYSALNEGLNGRRMNPVFYLSSSPWNLYDLLTEFFELQQIPPGPLLLQDYGIDEAKLVQLAHHDHKLHWISVIMEKYPTLPFLLIGDSGQHDPEIYRDAARAHPGRVKAIYIRDVASDFRDRSVAAIAEDLASSGIPLLLAPTTLEAAEHAAGAGWILEEKLTGIRKEIASDGS